MDITGNFQKVVIRINQKCLIAALVEVSWPVILTIKWPGITDIEMPHKFRKVALRRADQQVKVIWALKHRIKGGLQIYQGIGPATERILSGLPNPERFPSVHCPGRSHDNTHQDIGFAKVGSLLNLYIRKIEMSIVKIWPHFSTCLSAITPKVIQNGGVMNKGLSVFRIKITRQTGRIGD